MVQGYRQIKLLGQGAFGKCYLCQNPADNSRWVVKQIDISKMNPSQKRQAYHQAKIMSAFDHPNIIKFRDVYTTTNGNLNIVMDYADGGDLQNKIKNQRGRFFPQSQILDWFVQICLALKHVHDRKVLHRDIKGQNIFLKQNGMIKLGDFGIARVLSNTIDKARTMVGTPYYLSPEIIENKPYNFKSDVWSVGVLLYQLCALKPPFDGNSLHYLAMKIVRGNYQPVPPQYSRDLKQLISQMLSIDPSRRPSISSILKMPFIRSRIQNLLTESVRMQEFSHTVLHKQNIFDKKQPDPRQMGKQPPQQPPSRPPVKENPPKPAAVRQNPRPVNNQVRAPIYNPRPQPKPPVNQIRPQPKPPVNQVRPEPKPPVVNNPKPPVRQFPPRNEPKPPQREIPVRNQPKQPVREIPKIPIRDFPPRPDPRAHREPSPREPAKRYSPNLYIDPRQYEKEKFKPVQVQTPQARPVNTPQSRQVNLPAQFRGGLQDVFKPVQPVKEIQKKPSQQRLKKQKQLKKLQDEKIKRQQEQARRQQEEEARKQQKNKQLEQNKLKREEMRQKMLKDINRKKKKQKKQKNNFEIQWVGDYIPNQQDQQLQFQHALQVAYDQQENQPSEPLPIIQSEQQIIDRQDQLQNQEIQQIVQEQKKSEPCQFFFPTLQEQASQFSKIETFKIFIQDHLGTDTFLQVYKNLLQHPQETELCCKKLSLQPSSAEFVRLVDTLIFLEQNTGQSFIIEIKD